MSCCTPPEKEAKLSPKEAKILSFGSHISLRKTLTQTVGECPFATCQIYLGAHTSYTIRDFTAQDIAGARECCHKHNRTFYVHCPLVCNLGNPDDKAGGVASRTLDVISRELKVIEDLPAACVVHIGRVGKIHDVSRHINSLNLKHKTDGSRVKYPLLLEVASGQGTELGTSWEELRHIYEGVDKTKIGLVVDTQHAFASGLCSFEDHNSVAKMFEEASSICTNGISMVHLNDSECKHGSCKDRHSPLGCGHIWHSDTSSLVSLLDICRDSSIDVISETGDFAQDVKTISKAYNTK